MFTFVYIIITLVYIYMFLSCHQHSLFVDNHHITVHRMYIGMWMSVIKVVRHNEIIARKHFFVVQSIQ